MKARHLVLIAVVVGIVAYGVKAKRALEPFKRVTSRGGQSCRLVEVPGLIGAEDMQFDHETSTLWIAAADRRGDPSFRPHDGAVFRWKLDTDPAPVRVPVEGFPTPLRLHGMGLLVLPSGERRLFLVQHGDGKESVEIFRLDGAVLRHVRSVIDKSFISLNDVAPVGAESFYATNDHGRPPRFGHVLEDFGFLSNASLVYFDGSSGRFVASRLRYANGVTVDRGGRYIVVAETSEHRVDVFERLPDFSVRLVSRTEVDTSPDNLAQDETGAYLIGAHPSSMQFLRHAKDSRRHSASEVLSLRLNPDGTPAPIQTVWLDDGSLFSGSSVAAAHGSYWVVGAVFASGILMCRK
jgi:arylesterase/paraoxonase